MVCYFFDDLFFCLCVLFLAENVTLLLIVLLQSRFGGKPCTTEELAYLVCFVVYFFLVGALPDIRHIRLGGEGFASFDAQVFTRLDETTVLL